MKTNQTEIDQFVIPFTKWGHHLWGMSVQDGKVTTNPLEDVDWTEYHLEYFGGGIYEIEVCPNEVGGWTVWRGKIPSREVFVTIMQNIENAPPINWDK